MKKIFLLVVSLVSIAEFLAQEKINHYPASGNFPKVLKSKKLNKTQTCAVDTIYYTDAKASNQAVKVAFTMGSTTTGFVIAYAQKFTGSTNVTVRGFRWYGRSNDPQLATNPSINVVCEMYASDANGLPTGSALASEIVTVDTNSNNIEHNVVFSTPVTTSNAYVIVVKNNQSDQLFIYSNDETANDGAGEYLSSVYYEPLGSWRKSEQVFGFGDFDMLFLPFVEYDITASFTTLASGCQNVASSFSNTSSNHFANKMLNVDKFNGSSLQHDWTYGDGNTSNNQTTGSNTYASSGIFNQTLTSTINGWTMTCTDVAANAFTVNPQPAAPTSSSPAAVCEYDTLADLTASGGGGGATYTWYSNSGLTSQIGTGTPFTSDIHQVDTIYVTVTENGCESPGTVVPLDFDSNAVPVFSYTDQGAGVFDFIGPAATTFAWDFNDGGTETIQAPQHTFASSGPFNVCLDVTYGNGCNNQYCESIIMTGVDEIFNENKVSIYPVPTSGIVTINIEEFNETLEVFLYTTEGKMVYQGLFSGGNKQIDLSEFKSGTYFLTLKSQETVISRKKLLKY